MAHSERHCFCVMLPSCGCRHCHCGSRSGTAPAVFRPAKIERHRLQQANRADLFAAMRLEPRHAAVLDEPLSLMWISNVDQRYS
jgi:hypothetical protein